MRALGVVLGCLAVTLASLARAQPPQTTFPGTSPISGMSAPVAFPGTAAPPAIVPRARPAPVVPPISRLDGLARCVPRAAARARTGPVLFGGGAPTTREYARRWNPLFLPAAARAPGPWQISFGSACGDR